MWHFAELDKVISDTMKMLRVIVKSSLSSPRLLECKVPQGSLQGP